MDSEQQPKKVGLLGFLQMSMGSQFVIPVYQRNYTWAANKEVKQYFEDLENVLNGKYAKHFLGILIYLDTPIDYSSREFSVIDGQQRLTTTFLILYAIKYLMLDHGMNAEAEKLEHQFLINQFSSDKLKLKLKPLVADDEVYQKIVTGKFDEIVSKGSNVLKNFEWIKERLVELLKQYSFNEILMALDKLYVVCVPVTKNDSPQKIFESINSTGAKLSASDLIRNFILMDIPSDIQENLYDQYWKKIEGNLTSDSKKIESFFRMFLATKLMYLPNTSVIYSTFKDWFFGQIQANQNVEEVLKYKEQLSSILVSSVSEGSPIELIEGDYKTYLNSTDRVFDCIYTDPPYSDQVAYLERSQYFRDWLRIFYDSEEYTLSNEMLEKEIVVSNAPTRPGKTLETYLLDIKDMFETLSKHIKDNGFLVLTLKLGQNKYFKILTDFINSARRNGFEFVGNYEIDQTDPIIRRQATYLSTIMKQVIVVFQKLPSDKGYWFINAQNMEQWTIKNVYEQIEASSEKYIDISTSLNDLSLRASEQLGIVLKTSDLEKAASVIRDNFYVSEHNIHLDSNELYLGLEDSNSLLIKLYDIIPVIIKKLLRTKGSFCKDDLYAEIGYLLFDGDTALFKYLNDNEDCKNHINNLLDNYCEVLDGTYVLRQAHNIHDKSAVDISTLDGYELEQLMKELLQAEGYVDVIKTGKAGDRGVDLIATQKLANGSTQKVIFQCKRWIGNVGSTPIQRLHSMMTLDSKSIKRAVCVTTSTYTKEAREVAKMTGVELINGSDLLSKLQKYFGDKYYHGALQLVESENNLNARFAEAAKRVR